FLWDKGHGLMLGSGWGVACSWKRGRKNTYQIPSLRNQGGSSVAPTAEGSNTRDSQGKGVMVNDAAASSTGVSRSRPSSKLAPSFRDVSNDLFIWTSSLFLLVLIMPHILRMVLLRTMSVLHCKMMSHGGELFARYRGLNQSHHEYVLSTDSRLKGYEEKVANMTGIELQVFALKKQVSVLND
nr:hypothetical protein [Tanacetum cinerariifolium]